MRQRLSGIYILLRVSDDMKNASFTVSDQRLRGNSTGFPYKRERHSGDGCADSRTTCLSRLILLPFFFAGKPQRRKITPLQWRSIAAITWNRSSEFRKL